MEITARIENRPGRHEAWIATGGDERALSVPAKALGAGSAVNGGELLFLALATCYCNDVYREAAREGLRIERVEVVVRGEFGGRGEPARNVSYAVRVESPDDPQRVEALLRETDQVAEIQNTLRLGLPVTLTGVEVAPSGTTVESA